MTARRPFVELTPEQRDQHVAVAHPLAHDLLAYLLKSGASPYDCALACHLALAAISKNFGWLPQDFLTWTSRQFPTTDPPA